MKNQTLSCCYHPFLPIFLTLFIAFALIVRSFVPLWTSIICFSSDNGRYIICNIFRGATGVSLDICNIAFIGQILPESPITVTISLMSLLYLIVFFSNRYYWCLFMKALSFFQFISFVLCVILTLVIVLCSLSL